MVKVKLRDDVREYESGITALEIAKSLGAGLFKAVCVCKIDGEVKDLRTPVEKDCEIEFLTFDSDEGKAAFRHTASHILAQAVIGTVVAGSRSGDSRLYAFHLNPREGNAVGQCGEQALRAVFLGEGHSPVAPRLSHGPLRRKMLSAHD